MDRVLGLTILSFLTTAIFLIPFIDFLHASKSRRQKQITKDLFNKHTPIFDKFNAWKVGTPVGGGILIILVVCVFSLLAIGILGTEVNRWELFVIFFSFVSFGLLGLYDDIKKLVSGGKTSFFGLRFRHKFIIQWILALIIGSIIYFKLGYSFIFIQGIGLVSLGPFFILFAAFVIVSFANACNIADGLDGLASGLLLICLVAFLIISQQIDQTLGIFSAILLGSITAFLYFNIYKARIWLGDVGSLSLGASFAVTGLLTGKTLALVVIGGVFIIEVGSSLFQILGKKFLGRKVFPVAPFHLYLQKRGWEEPKIVMRAWLVGFFLAVLGVWLALIA